jgi:hypothetical protein
MAEEGKFTNSNLVIFLNFVLFFFGFIFVTLIKEEMSADEFNAVFIMFYTIVILLITGLSFNSHSPSGGIVIGLSFSGSFWIGFLIDQVINYKIGQNLIESEYYVYYIIFTTLAFLAFGLFFGLLGYVSDQLLVESPISETYIFRDYWSSVYTLGKSNRREFNDLDRKLTRVHLTARNWWRQQIKRVTQSKPELTHVNYIKQRDTGTKQSRNWKIGDIYDVASGKRIYEEVINPMDLVSIYRPSILNIPATSNRIGGAGRLAFEEMVSRFLGWFITSRVIWGPYIVASVLLTYFMYTHYAALYSPEFGGLQAIVATSILLSLITLYLVRMLHSISLEIFNKRPDVRTLLFTMYLIVLLFYGFYYQMITSTTKTIYNFLLILTTTSEEVLNTILKESLVPWISTTSWLVSFTIILAVAYIFIHRESEVSNVYLYADKRDTDEENPVSPFKNEGDKPYWLKDDDTPLYWVLRYMYYWRYELTLIPHSDWERIEVWVNAKTGKANWIVSDYHYRELWYKVEGDLMEKGLHVGILANFHTPIPFVSGKEIEVFTRIISQSKKDLLRILFSGKIDLGEVKTSNSHLRHPPWWIETYGLKGLSAGFCSNLNWFYWRYPWGIDNFSKYVTYPSTLVKEQPNYT